MSLVALSPGTVTLTLRDADQTQQLVLSVGTPGPAGPAGANGAPGVGVPAGGTTGQVLKKSSSVDYATEWGTAASAATWGGISGTLSAQTDLQAALNAKFNNPTGNSTQYIAGDGTLITFPTLATANKLTATVYNQTGATLTKGTVVYINGAHGNLPTVAKSLASGEGTSAGTYGFVAANIGNNSSGTIVIAGVAENLDTQAYTDGDKLYLSPTVAGGWTTTKPSAPDHMVYLGVVTRAHPTLGTIQLRIANGFEVAELHDAAISDPQDADLFVYESATSLWKNKSFATLGLLTVSAGDAAYYPLSSNPAGYATESWVSSQGYITSAPNPSADFMMANAIASLIYQQSSNSYGDLSLGNTPKFIVNLGTNWGIVDGSATYYNCTGFSGSAYGLSGTLGSGPYTVRVNGTDSAFTL